MIEKVKGKKQLVYNFEDLIAGSIRNAPVKPSKTLKDTTQLGFLHNRELLKRYGHFGDADKDGYLNFADSWPYDSSRHGLFSTITKVLNKASDIIRSPFKDVGTAIATGGASTSPTGSTWSGYTTSTSGYTGGTTTSSGTTSTSGGGGSSGGGTTSTSLPPTTAGVYVTDFTSGTSVTTKTETSPTGKTTTTRTIGGRALSPQEQASYLRRVTQRELEGRSPTPAPLREVRESKSTESEVIESKIQDYANIRYYYYQDLVNKGQISVEDAQKYLNQEVEIYQKEQTERAIREKPVKSTIEVAPTFVGRYARSIEREGGYAKGTLTFFGVELGGAYTRRELQQDKPYQAYASGRAIEFFTGTVPYFTPAGAGLLLLGGVETLGTERGRKSVKMDIIKMKAEGKDPMLAQIIGYGTPLAELGIGGLGVGSQLSRLGRGKPTTEFIARETPVKPGTSQVDVIAKTSVGKDNVFAVVTGKSIQTPKGTISGGQGFIYSPEGRSYIKVAGTSQPRGDVSRIYKNLKMGGQGEGFTGETITITPKVKSYEIIQKGEKAKYVGAGRKYGDITYVEAGKPEKLRIYPDTLKLTTRPNIFGYVVRNVPEENLISNLIQRPASIKKTPLSKTFGETKQVQVSKQAQQTALDLVAGARTESLKMLQETTPETLKLVPVSQFEGKGLYERTVGGLFPGELIDTSQKSGELTLLESPLRIRTDTKQKGVTTTLSAQSLLIGDVQQEGITQPSVITPRTPQQEKPRSRETPGQTPRFFFPGEEIPSGPVPPIIFGLPKKEKTLKEKPYDAYGYVDATKTNKARYEKLNKEPLTLMGALDKMSEFVDKNITARGKVSPTPPKIQKGKKVYQKVAEDAGETGYFEENLFKFRPYRVQKGQKKPLQPGTYIESAPYRLDSFGETGQIGQARINSLIFSGFGNSKKRGKKKGFLI